MRAVRPSLILAAALHMICPSNAADQQFRASGFHRFDSNKDGKITADELKDPSIFARYDTNSDGEITRQEYFEVALGGKFPRIDEIDRSLKTLDHDGNGSLSRKEAGSHKWFDTLDADQNGVVDQNEIEFLKKIVRGRSSDSVAPAAQDQRKESQSSAGPLTLGIGESGTGRMVANISLIDLNGTNRDLYSICNRRGCVIVMSSSTCPVSKRYLPVLKKLEDALTPLGISMLIVNPFPSESEGDIRAQFEGLNFASPYVRDLTKSVSLQLRPRTTSEVFLLDAAKTIVYRGAIDDQYGIGYSRDAATHHYLMDAVKALIEGKAPVVVATTAPGCELDSAEEASSQLGTQVTYHRDVSRILQQYCVRCHRAGGIAPFSLEDFESVIDRAAAIRRVVQDGQMPPWFAAKTDPSTPSQWANDCSLPGRERAELLHWLSAKDRPLGDPSDAPLKREYPALWSIGEPDLVIPLSRAYEVKAEGTMPYVRDVVETQLTEARWVSAYEIIPSARDVVHHVIVDVYEKNASIKDRGEGRGGYWAAYVPGNTACVYPHGFARRIPAGAKVSFQIHYTPSGKATQERLRLGLVFAKEKPEYELRTIGLANTAISIPPGASEHAETFSKAVPFDLPITGFLAHMHLRGKSFRYEVRYPNGTNETLLDIPKYDFNWQLRYECKEPKIIPRGSTMTVTAVYDNSQANRANPDPKKWVKWGSQTSDEMMIGYLEYFAPVR